MELGTHSWTEVDGAARPVLAVPLGSCEQHGPHLPIDTDTRVAEAVAQALAERRPHVLLAPTLGITASGEHQGFPGTLSIGVAALETVLVELVRSADWSAGVILVNGHGGNTVAVRNAVARLTAEGRRVLSWWPRLPGSDTHAGRTETSLLLAIAPHLVRSDEMVAGNVAPIGELIEALSTSGVAAVSPNGVLGDPTGASADEGHALLDSLVADLVANVDAWS